jgi:hypothetical protein
MYWVHTDTRNKLSCINKQTPKPQENENFEKLIFRKTHVSQVIYLKFYAVLVPSIVSVNNKASGM